MWLDIYKSNKCMQLFEVDIVRHIWASPKLCQIVMQIHTKNELSCKVGFLHVVFQSFQVGLVMHVHSYWKHQVSYISQMKLDMNFIFLHVLRYTGPNLHHFCVWQSDAVPFCENYAKLLFCFKTFRKGIEWYVLKFGVWFFKKVPFWPKSDTALIF